MSRERCLHLPPELPEWRRSGPFLVIALALHLVVLAWPRSPTVTATPLPLQVHLIEIQAAMPELLPVSAPPPPPAPAKPARKRPPRQKQPPVLAMTPEQQAPAPATPLVAAPPEPVVAAASLAAAVAAAPSAAPAVVAAHYNAAYLNNPRPQYPSLSRRLGEEGRVLLRVQVTADGRASAVELEKSSSFVRLDEAARKTVAGWRFVPARRGDEAIEASVIVPIVFRLDS